MSSVRQARTLTSMSTVAFASVVTLVLTNVVHASDGPRFEGMWATQFCPSGIALGSEECSHFSIQLIRKKDRICGGHAFATSRAGRLDEGDGNSIVGSRKGAIMQFRITSGRADPTVTLKGTLRISGTHLIWRASQNKSGDCLIPPSARLKSQSIAIFSQEAETQLNVACQQWFSTLGGPKRYRGHLPR